MISRLSLRSLLVPLVALAACLAAPQALADTGVITFEGETTAATCTVEGGTSNLSTFTVDMPPISTSILTPGDVAGRTRFAMRLVNCADVANGVRAHFEAGPTVDATHGTLRPSNGGSVHFALFDESGARMDIGARHQGPSYAADSTMYYEVAYFRADAAPIVPGKFNGSVAYSLQYD